MPKERSEKKEGKRVYRKWTPEQKFATIMEYFTERKSVADICRKHQLSLQLFSRWGDYFIVNGKNVFEKQENPDQQLLREMEEYKLIVAEFTHANEAFKKNTTPEERREVVALLRPQHTMRTACRRAGPSPHALYCRPEKNARPLSTASVELVRKVVEDRTFYGSRRVAASIRRNGVRINRKAVQRIMRAMDWTLPARKRDRAAANSAKPVFVPTAPDQLWETDITYVWCGIDR